MAIEQILVVDDEPLMRNFTAELLRRLGKCVTTASDGEEAIRLLHAEPFDLVLTDQKMPIKGGHEVLKAAKSLYPNCFVILMTAFGTIEAAVETMRLGAFHYLIKPFPPEALETALEQCETQLRLLKENHYLKESSGSPLLTAHSPSMKQLLQDLDKIAKSQASVFITGESGTGKEVIAGAIHRLSPRSQHSFIKVNCAAIPETLVESEFFGHERGAFTGALARKTGRFELADKGTLLLDEVTEIPLALQPKLLRALQEQEFERVGGEKPIRVNVRFLATSNRNMEEAIRTKVFREDLFYRLNVVPIHIPPLRQRTEDIVPLADYFLEKFCADNHKMRKKLSKSATDKLLSYTWPGNVRELANIIERTVVLTSEEEISDTHIRLEPREILPGLPCESTLRDMEKKFILHMLTIHRNRTKASSVLGISVRTLRNKLKEYALDDQMQLDFQERNF